MKWLTNIRMQKFEALLKQYGTMMNRYDTWRAAANFSQEFGCKRFVETGCYRGTESDGCSTVLLAALAKAMGGKLDSYELNPNNIRVAKQALARRGLERVVTFHVGDSVTNLASRTDPIDFAYLDSYDCGLGPDYSECQNHQLAECEAVLPILSKKAVILLDDLLDGGKGKPVLAMKRLALRGFKEVARGYQVLFASDDTTALPRTNFAVLCGHLKSFVPLAISTIYQNKAQYALQHGYDLRILRSLGQYTDPKSHADGFSWARLEEMWRLVNSGNYGWVWCVGGDTLVTNFRVTLESIVALAETPQAETMPLPACPPFPNSPAPKGVVVWKKPSGHRDYGRKHLIICGERVVPMQADSFLVRGSPEGAAYLRDILDHYPQYKHHTWVENQTMIDLRDKHAAITFMCPQHLLNSVDYSRWYKNHPAYRDGTDCFGNRGQWKPGDFLIHWPASGMADRLKWLEQYRPQIVY